MKAKNKLDANDISSFFLRAIDILFLKNPVRTSMGVLIGFIMSGFAPVFAPSINHLAKLDISKVPGITWIALGVFGANISGSPLKIRLPEDVELLFTMLDEAKRRGIFVNPAEVRQKFRLIVEKYANNVVLNEENERELKELKQQLSAPQKATPNPGGKGRS